MSGCRGEIGPDDDVPRIFVRCTGDEEPEIVQYLEYGIEEEGVSWAVQRDGDGDVVATAHQASTDSKLKIGVGITPDGRVVIHHKQLPGEEPLFDVADVTAETARKLGSNSGRLAKGIPLKPVG